MQDDDDLARESEPEVVEDASAKASSRVSNVEMGEEAARSSSVSSNEAQDNVGDDPLDVSSMRQIFKR